MNNQGSAREAAPEQLGRRLCPAFFAATKLVKMYGSGSQVALDAVVSLMKVIDAVNAAFGFTAIRVSSEQLFLNEYRVRMDSEGFMAFEHVLGWMGRRNIGEIRIGAGATEDDVTNFLTAVHRVDRDSETPLEDVKGFMEMGQVHEIDVYEVRDLSGGHDQDKLGDLRVSSVQHYTKAAFAYDLVRRAMRESGKVDPRKLKRLIQGMVDIIERDPTALLALTGMKGYGSFHAGHAINVAILTLEIGRAMGMSRSLLAKLGLAAALHDIGRVTCPTGPEHTREGAHVLLDNLGFTEGGLRCVMASLAHHDPAKDEDGALAPLAHRILAVADFFDLATTPRGEHHRAQTVRSVIDHMTRDSGVRFDRRVVLTLSRILGAYPYGTTIQLDDGTSAIVCGRGENEAMPSLPIVRITEDADGKQVADGEPIDLSQVDPVTGKPAHAIAAAYAPHEAFASMAAFAEAL